ncbi:hypothetical protein PFISCL1PPCAC_7843, partial [Pristionchus fissidentatus]
ALPITQLYPSMLTRFFLLFSIGIAIFSILVSSASLGDVVSSLQHGTLRLTSEDRWVADSSEEDSNEEQREAFRKQLKNPGLLHQWHDGLQE